MTDREFLYWLLGQLEGADGLTTVRAEQLKLRVHEHLATAQPPAAPAAPFLPHPPGAR